MKTNSTHVTKAAERVGTSSTNTSTNVINQRHQPTRHTLYKINVKSQLLPDDRIRVELRVATTTKL